MRTEMVVESKDLNNVVDQEKKSYSISLACNNRLQIILHKIKSIRVKQFFFFFNLSKTMKQTHIKSVLVIFRNHICSLY